jgi:hypothetical protein
MTRDRKASKAPSRHEERGLPRKATNMALECPQMAYQQAKPRQSQVCATSHKKCCGPGQSQVFATSYKEVVLPTIPTIVRGEMPKS